MAEARLADLVSNALRAVTFNNSGVILDFGGAWFTAHAWPTVHVGGSEFNLGDRGYRDALCAFITHEVVSVEESDADGLRLSFGLGWIMTKPDPTELSGPEVA